MFKNGYDYDDEGRQVIYEIVKKEVGLVSKNGYTPLMSLIESCYDEIDDMHKNNLLEPFL